MYFTDSSRKGYDTNFKSNEFSSSDYLLPPWRHYLIPPCFLKIFFSTWVFYHQHSRFTGQQGEGMAISLTPLYNFHPLHRHLEVSRAITAEGSPLRIARSRTQTGIL